MTADLHIHTLFSDGDVSPEAVVQEAVRVGLKTIAITDHDILEGYCHLSESHRNMGVEVIPGIEVSAQHGPQEVHIIGLWVNTDYTPLKDKVTIILEARRRRILKILAKLKLVNVNIDPAFVFEIAGEGIAAGRVHVAEALRRKGYVSSLSEAFLRYIGDHGIAHVSKNFISPVDAIDLIHAAGGVSVLCHPGSKFDEGRCVEFVKMGIDAIEAFCPFYSRDTSESYLDMAAFYGIGVSGGTDYHGSRRPEVRLGDVRLKEEHLNDLRERRARILKQGK